MASFRNLMSKNLIRALTCKPYYRVGSVIIRSYADDIARPPIRTNPPQHNRTPASNNDANTKVNTEAGVITNLSTSGDNRVQGNNDTTRAINANSR